MRCLHFIAGLFVILVSVACGRGQVDQPTVRLLGEGATEVFQLTGLQSHLTSLFESPAFVELMDGKFGDAFRSAPGGLNFERETLVEWYEQNRSSFPDEVIIGADASTYQWFEPIFWGSFLLSMSQAAELDNESKLERDLIRVHSELGALIEGLKCPNLAIVLTWPDSDLAEQWFTTASFAIRPQLEQLDMDVQTSNNHFVCRGKLGAFVDSEALSAILFSTVTGEESDEETIERAVARLQEFEFVFRLERIDHSLRLVIGDLGKDDLGTSSLGELFSQGNLEIAFMKWDFNSLKSLGQRMLTNYQAWESSELFKAFRERDLEDLASTVKSVAEQLVDYASVGQMRVSSRSNGIVVDSLYETLRPRIDLRGHDILKLIPANAEAYFLDSQNHLGQYLMSWMEQSESRMAMQQIRADLTDDANRASTVSAMVNGWYEHFGPFRIVVQDKLAKLNSSPVVFLGHCRGRLDSLKFGFAVTGTKDVALSNEEIPVMATIALFQDREAGEAAVREFFKEFVDGLHRVVGKPAPGDSLFETMELAPGVQATRVELNWIAELSGKPFSLAGDFEPHFFWRDRFFVFSTSSKLSQQILKSSAAGTLKLPESSDPIIGRGRLNGDTVAQGFRFVFKLMSRLIGAADLRGRANSLEQFTQGFVEVFRLLGQADLLVTDSKGRIRMRLEFDYSR